MRKSEAMAIDSKSIYNGTLMINQQVSPHVNHLVAPKCGIIRSVPLSRITQAALSEIRPDKQGRYFPNYTYNCITTDLMKLRVALATEDKENAVIWKSLTPHMLRHSANTNLLVAGASPVLVAEYLAWKHQELVDMQRRYTHMVAMNLKPVADKIDELYEYKDAKKNILEFSKQGT